MGVLTRQTLTRSCDAARADLGELLDEEADDQLGLGGEGQFFLARWRRELQGTRKSATSVGGWSTGGARAHAHQPLHPLSSVLALLLLVHHGLVVQIFRMVRPCWYLASRDIVRPLPSRAGGGRRERCRLTKDRASRGTETSCALVTDFDFSRVTIHSTTPYHTLHSARRVARRARGIR